MKISLDAQPLQVRQKTGHAYYVQYLVEALQRLPEFSTGGFELQLCQPKQRTDLNTLRRLLWDQWGFPGVAGQSDILCATAFSVPLFRRAKKVAIVHDLALWHFPENMRGFSGWFLRHFVPWSFRFADKLVAVSESTKQDLISFLGISPDKVTVVHEGVSPFYTPALAADIQMVEEKYSLRHNHYLLFVGTLEPRKNLPFLIEALAPILRRLSLPLVLVGKRGWQYEEIFSTIERLGLRDLVIEVGRITDEEKRALLSGAMAFCFPSRYEGFGLPLLEAMGCGCPVISADNSSMPEVVGQAGLLLPLDAPVWATALEELAHDGGRRAELAKLGQDRAKEFSWDTCAQRITAVLKEVAFSGSSEPKNTIR